MGTYGEDYATAPPIVLLSLPPAAALRLKSPVAPLVRECLDVGVFRAERLDVAFQLHAGLQRAPCFVCGGRECANLVLHAWLFAGDVGSDGDGGGDAPDLRADVLAGIFDARGVQRAHAGEGGPLGPAPFDRVSKRVVHYHDARFSPNNLHLTLHPSTAVPEAAVAAAGAAAAREASEAAALPVDADDGARGSPGGGSTRIDGGGAPGAATTTAAAAAAAAARTSTHRSAAPPVDSELTLLDRDRRDVVTFVSFAADAYLQRGAVTLHVLPLGDGPADWVRGWVRGCDTLGQLLGALRAHLPAVHAQLAGMLQLELELEAGGGGGAGGEGAEIPHALGAGGWCAAGKAAATHGSGDDGDSAAARAVAAAGATTTAATTTAGAGGLGEVAESQVGRGAGASCCAPMP